LSFAPSARRRGAPPRTAPPPAAPAQRASAHEHMGACAARARGVPRGARGTRLAGVLVPDGVEGDVVGRTVRLDACTRQLHVRYRPQPGRYPPPAAAAAAAAAWGGGGGGEGPLARISRSIGRTRLHSPRCPIAAISMPYLRAAPRRLTPRRAARSPRPDRYRRMRAPRRATGAVRHAVAGDPRPAHRLARLRHARQVRRGCRGVRVPRGALVH